MVSIFRKAIGFAVLFFIFEQIYSYGLVLLESAIDQASTVLYGIPVYIAIAALHIGAAALFTYFYVCAVKAHLSQSFRISAVLFLLLLTLVYVVVLALTFTKGISPVVIGTMLSSGLFWLQMLVSAIFHYLGFTLGNWLASFRIKTQGHI